MAKEIALDGVRKEYRTLGTTHVAVDDVTLSIPAGSFTTIVGPSGCGKTTTLRMIAGLESPTSGRICFGETDVTDLPPQKRNVAMVFQSIALYPHMTVRQNVGYGLKIAGVPKRERDERIEEAAATLQISDQLEKKPAELSGGQQQRVALGSAFVQDPDVLLLDEPMSDLDAKLKAELRVEVQRLHQQLDTTVVYVTHDQTEAMTMSDYVVLLKEGHVAQFDPPKTLFDYPDSEYVARFIGTPSTNVVDCTVRNRDDATGDGDSDGHGEGVVLEGHGLTIPIPGDTLGKRAGETVGVGIRPQYLTPAGGEHTFEITVEVVEPLGTESVVHAQTADGTRIDVVTDAVGGLDHGDSLVVGFDRRDVFVFDAEGETILFGDSLDAERPESVQ
ncbi:ABC transporter ATP-binding protein [Halorussus halophilus]|uniref:ABC transporter ATP-binding protein n=1 Tax=Halorussus halophilus TaxID=2650975 RepID=UPI001300DDEC|nr:ABC transporter ATP-binding protein [Halorussus halophilus]